MFGKALPVTGSIERNRGYLTDLFGGPFRGHAVIMDPCLPPTDCTEDAAASSRPVKEWVPVVVRNYEHRLKWHEETDDDSVPYATPWTGTEIFAAAFGCPVHIYPDSPPSAQPLVQTAEEADRLPVPDPVNSRPLARIFELASLVREQLGPGVPISVPDIQSPFDIACLVWRKESLYLALHESPEAVKRLVEKCHALLKAFLVEYLKKFPDAVLCHCPYAWAPAELGCWLSEDEAGSMSPAMFEEFCLPSLTDLSRAFGGIFIHCCATADHQYPSFGKIPNLRGLHRVFQSPGPRPAIEAFAGKTVLMVGYDERILDMALPESRFLFNVGSESLEDAKRTYEGIRARCPRL